jgi:hypothetical protein
MRCICGELEAIKKYGHHPNCEIHTNGVHRSDSEIEIDRLKAENARLREALELIAMPVRSDGTYNRSREACEQLAREALKGRE